VDHAGGTRRDRTQTRATITTTCVDGFVSVESATASPAEASSRPSWLGCHRWVVERTVSWLAGCRRLHRRYEYKAEQFLAFVGIAAALICHRRLASCRPVLASQRDE